MKKLTANVCEKCGTALKKDAAKCLCGHDVGAAIPKGEGRYMNLLSVAGRCPVKLGDCDGMRDWVMKMLDHGHARRPGVHYQPSALRLCLREFFDDDASLPAYKEALAELNSIYHESPEPQEGVKS